MPEGFLANLYDEAEQGAGNIFSGMTSALNPNRGAIGTLGVPQAAIGALQLGFAPITATSRAIAQNAQDVALRIGEALGIPGPANANISAGIATATDLVGNLVAAPKALATAAPHALKVGKSILSHLPGAQVGLREEGMRRALAIPESLRPPITSEEIYSKVGEVNPIVPYDEIRKAATPVAQSKSLLAQNVPKLETLKADLAIVKKDLEQFGTDLAGNILPPSGNFAKVARFDDLTRKKQEFENSISAIEKANEPSLTQAIHGAAERAKSGDLLGGVRNLALYLKNYSGTYPLQNSISFQAARATMVDLNALIRQAKGQQGAEFGMLMQLKKGFWKALETSGKEPGGSKALGLLREGNETFQREMAVDILDDVVGKNFGRYLEGTDRLSTTAARAMNQLTDAVKKDPALFEKLPTGAVKQVMKSLDEIRQLKVNPPPKGVNVGSALVNQRGLMGYAAAGLLGSSYGPIGAGVAVGVPWAISKVLQSKVGSSAMINVLKRDGQISAKAISGLVAVADADRAVKEGLAQQVKESLRADDVSIEDKINAVTARNALFSIIDTAKSIKTP